MIKLSFFSQKNTFSFVQTFTQIKDIIINNVQAKIIVF